MIGESTANEPQLAQTFKDVANLPRTPEFFLFVGDMVRNETSGKVLAGQLDAWRRVWDASPLANGTTRLVPIPGNHELLRAVQYAKDGWYEVPDPSAVEAWRTWVSDLDGAVAEGTIAGSADAADRLAGDPASFSYSFGASATDGSSIRFVVLDTDSRYDLMPEDSCLQAPVGPVEFDGAIVAGTRGQMVPGWTPVHLMARELDLHDEAEAVFVLGHKPILWPVSADPDSLDSDGRASIYNCGKHRLAATACATLGAKSGVVAYLCAHRHHWQYSEIYGGVRQLIAGNGGSPLDTDAKKAFGFTLVEIRRNGEVSATSWERPAPTPIDDPSGVGPARPETRVILRSPRALESPVVRRSASEVATPP